MISECIVSFVCKKNIKLFKKTHIVMFLHVYALRPHLNDENNHRS